MDKKKANDQPYVIVRTYSAGVFAANLVSRENKEAKLANARRLWYWDGAASLSQLAVEGVTKPKTCKFSVPVPLQEVTEVIEVLYASAEAEANIKAVPEWRA